MDEYPLTRDYIDVTRLNLQHFLWTEMFGYLVHPAIDIHTNSKLKIVDVGCGTGAWLISLASRVPVTAELIGLDIDESQAPPAQYLPSNVTLRQWNIFEEVPQDLVGYFDILHVRLLVFVIHKDPSKVLYNFLRLLKPGGWIQWAEPDILSMQVQKTSETHSDEVLMELWNKTAVVNTNLVPSWPGDLVCTLEAAGCLDVQLHKVRAEQHLEYAMHSCNLLIYDMIVQTAKKGSNAQKAEIAELVNKVAHEARKGTMFSFARLTVIGRKSPI